jgi:hypothetical protein
MAGPVDFNFRGCMSELTRILEAVDHGDVKASQELLPLVYQELRRLAAWRMAQENPGRPCSPPR